ncbi:MAG TPA: peptidoglycan DD-metalloendopeptidase family protein [Anaerolineales bacterium]|nr:peptidoglycan DD-metalloendopeptidase family protein [Anaerolineales bacterium]
MRNRFFLFLLTFALFLTFPKARSISAQTADPIYIVQPGDTLSFIAERFNLSLEELIAANPSINPDFLTEGQRIVIPGLEGVTGVLETEIIALGDSLRNLSRRTQVSDEQLIKLNRLVSPTELYVGISLIIPMQEGQTELSSPISAEAGETLLELAVKTGSNPWTFTTLNKLSGTWEILPGDVLYSLNDSGENTSGLPSAFLSASIEPLPMVQGGTEIIRAQVREGYSLSGMLVDRPLHFFPTDEGLVALQGIHALLEPGVYPIRLEATNTDGHKQAFEQMVLVTSGGYASEELYVPPETIDPTVSEAENQVILSIISASTPIKFWDGIFSSPAVYPDQFTSRFGTRRIYYGIGTDLVAEGFHTGLDFAGGEGLQIFAPAPGRVVFAGPLTVRGNATIIDHGWGIYSGFWHQSEILVHVGDKVEQGQVIGLVGGTGRVTGAHLHWEVWVNGVQVNPLDWLNQAYP